MPFPSNLLSANCLLELSVINSSRIYSGTNSVATAISTDFYRLFNANHSEKHYLTLAKTVKLDIEFIGTGLALIMAKWEITPLWEQFNMLLDVFTGGLFNVFLLGIFLIGPTLRGLFLAS